MTDAEGTRLEGAPQQQSLYARVYAPARYVLVLAVGVLAALATAYFPDLVEVDYAAFGLFVFFVATMGFALASHVLGYPLERVMIWVAPFDLVSLGLLGVAFHNFEDPAYPFLLATPIFYAQLVRRREAWMIAAASSIVYLLSHAPYLSQANVLVYATLLVKAGLIVSLGALAAVHNAWQRDYEDGMDRATSERERLNEQLSRRLSELQAVSQITEIIHSSLDFDRVGPLVLEVLTKVIGVPSCCLFVIDKRKSETLFTASVGVSAADVDMNAPFVLDDSIESAGTPFSCVPVIDHHQMMVVFCAEAEVVDSMHDEDRLVLQAVSSELVVAVENSRLYKLTKRLAITDELTSLYNYRYLQQRLDEEIERARRYSKDLSLLMLDVDDFKRFNDVYGHIAGDAALAELGRVVRSIVREVDVVCRYGGEEFSVVLPETDAAGAYVVGEKIREAISNHAFSDGDGIAGQHLTISIGLATLPTHAEDKETLLRLADDALYQAKHGGKDRVRSPMSPSASASRPTEQEG